MSIYKYRKGAKVRFTNGGVDPLKILKREQKSGLPEYTVQSKSLNVFYLREWELEKYEQKATEGKTK